MRRIGIVVLGLALAGCVAEDGGGQPPAGEGYIEISSGGAFSGSATTRVHADDRIETGHSGPFGEGAQTGVSPGRPGLYAELAAVFRAEAPKALAAQDRDIAVCMDYGSDSVRAEPPIGGVQVVSAQCPDPAVQGLQRRLLAVIAAPG